jgi:hypothetical protein
LKRILRSHTFRSLAEPAILATIERQLWQAASDKKTNLPFKTLSPAVGLLTAGYFFVLKKRRNAVGRTFCDAILRVFATPSMKRAEKKDADAEPNRSPYPGAKKYPVPKGVGTGRSTWERGSTRVESD